MNQMVSETRSITAMIIALMNEEDGFHVPDFPVHRKARGDVHQPKDSLRM
jgi:hypothetical protein